MKASDVKPGMALEMDNQVYLVVSTEHVKPGKGPAYVQVKLKNVKTGGHVEKRLRSVEEVEQAMLDRRELEYLYSDGSGAVFMDSETFDQLSIGQALLGDDLLYLKPNTVVTALVYEGQVMSVELPASVDLQITETPPVVRGATATNQLKDAVCETGLKTRVPPFIKQGEVVRINTDTGEYIGRVKED